MLRLLLKQGKFATYLWSNLRETKFRVTTDTRFAQRACAKAIAVAHHKEKCIVNFVVLRGLCDPALIMKRMKGHNEDCYRINLFLHSIPFVFIHIESLILIRYASDPNHGDLGFIK